MAIEYQNVPPAPQLVQASHEEETVLLQNYENPSNPETWIPFKLSKSEYVVISIYDVTGRLVNVLVDEEKAAGHYRIDWRAVDENDIPVASGVYYIKLQIGKRYITKRILLLK